MNFRDEVLISEQLIMDLVDANNSAKCSILH